MRNELLPGVFGWLYKNDYFKACLCWLLSEGGATIVEGLFEAVTLDSGEPAFGNSYAFFNWSGDWEGLALVASVCWDEEGVKNDYFFGCCGWEAVKNDCFFFVSLIGTAGEGWNGLMAWTGCGGLGGSRSSCGGLFLISVVLWLLRIYFDLEVGCFLRSVLGVTVFAILMLSGLLESLTSFWVNSKCASYWATWEMSALFWSWMTWLSCLSVCSC